MSKGVLLGTYRIWPDKAQENRKTLDIRKLHKGVDREVRRRMFNKVSIHKDSSNVHFS